jgi:DNA-binding response OmpR family regulator
MGKRLMLVEDEPTLARALVRLLRRSGYDVTLATSCEEAQRLLGTFSVGVFDIDLPDGDGVELAERVRRNGMVRRLVFFSGTPVAKKRVRALGLGPFVEKSKGYAELEAAIASLFDCKQAKVAGDEHSESGDPSKPPPSGVRDSRPD